MSISQQKMFPKSWEVFNCICAFLAALGYFVKFLHLTLSFWWSFHVLFRLYYPILRRNEWGRI